ncbi:unnamed protein product [Caenorhabditis angaria]|uniref:Uncharacterized protein n=1 Tax=Caenorhabditis angaria TaxID=860376 RepID=A0A9P1IHT0_9PELO|nr:unnamed protein product [Caenorhabditis angaria]
MRLLRLVFGHWYILWPHFYFSGGKPVCSIIVAPSPWHNPIYNVNGIVRASVHRLGELPVLLKASFVEDTKSACLPPYEKNVSSVAQLGIMGWQMAAIKYERDRAANTLLPNYNTYGRFDIPSYYESYWQSPEERYYTGLFVIQVLCLIAAFFLLFASAAMIYGIHTWSKYLVWPWFPVMISSILASLAYCIMWWAGDVRDYWLAITIIEIIVVFINIYCVVVVMMYYRRINATTDEYEGKDRRGVRYKINRNFNSRRDLLDSYEGIHRSPSPKQYKPLAQPYPVFPTRPYSRAGVPQTPIPLPPTQVNTPYPIDPMEYRVEPIVKRGYNNQDEDQDPVGSWVREQNSIDRSQHSEPITMSKQVHPTTTLQHSRSVPSLHDGTLVSHRDCKHHRSSSRRRKSSRSRLEFDGSESDTEFTRARSHRHRSSSHRRRKSRSRYDESVYDSEADRERERERDRRKGEKRHGSTRSSKRRRRDDEDRRSDRNLERDTRRDRDRDDRSERNFERDGRRDRDDRSDRNLDRGREDRNIDRTRPRDSRESQEPELPFQGGITIPQHIVIPPSTGERGPDGQLIPQKYHINSEITINYDQNGRPIQQSTQQEPYSRRRPMQIQSTF